MGPGFPLDVLAIFTVVMFVLAVVTYGTAVPSGLFVPCILIGGGFGRFAGELARMYFGDKIQPGVYALIGSAAMLSGVCRITVTLTVILYETTDQLQLIMPIMSAIMVAKWVADQFNISVYDMHVELKCMPFVEPHPPQEMEGLAAECIMSQPPVTLLEVDTVGRIMEVLESTRHNGFPVVGNERPSLRGVILRNQLIVILSNRRHHPIGTSWPQVLSPRGTRAPERLISAKHFSSSLQSKTLGMQGVLKAMDGVPHDTPVDLRPYVNSAPIMVSPKCPIERCFTLFRAMGIRHLPVVDENHYVAGIITRKELMSQGAGMKFGGEGQPGATREHDTEPQMEMEMFSTSPRYSAAARTKP